MPSDNIAIRVSHLSKQYKLGGPQEPYHTFRDAIVNSLKVPIKVFHKAPSGEGFWALKDVSFEVEAGEVVGIIGRNGAGKSTLLKILSRITSPTEGTVELHGRVGSLLEVGTGFHPELTGRENIYLSGSILGMKRREIDAKLDEIVKFSEIEQFLDTPVKRYSSGMYVRLAFAVAAHLEPEILIVDEVLAVGDATFQKKCLGKMGEVAKEGRTVLFVSHNMGAIESLCQKTILMMMGTISTIGTTKDVINNYLISASDELETPIALRKDRKGTGKLIIDDIIINSGQIKNRSLQLDFSICNHSKKECNHVLLSIVITDYLGRQISNLVNYIIDKPLIVGIYGTKVRVIINNINLVPGTYNINTFVSSDIQNSEIFDWVMNAAKFVVPDYDYYSMGHIPYIKGETIYMDYDYVCI